MLSAKEVENNGAPLGELIKGVLQNTEELTLCLIDLNKKVEALKKENEELREEISKNFPQKLMKSSYKVLFLILATQMLFSYSCTRKKHNPFCSDCVKGSLFFSACPDFPLFVAETGDSSLIYPFSLSKQFKKEGTSVCVNLEEYSQLGFGSCVGVYGNLKRYKVKCIKRR